MRSITQLSFWARTNIGNRARSPYDLQPHYWYGLYVQSVPLNNNQPTQKNKLSAVFFSAMMYSKKRDCASVLHTFKQTTYWIEEWQKQLLQLKSGMFVGCPEQWREFHCLCWTVFVFKSSYLFFFVWLLLFARSMSMLFLNNCLFLFLFFEDFEWEVKLHQLLLCKVTLPKANNAVIYLCASQKFSLL